MKENLETREQDKEMSSETDRVESEETRKLTEFVAKKWHHDL